MKKELAMHADGEERYFYVPLIEVDKMQDHATYGIAEHHEIDESVEKFRKTAYDTSAWLKYAKDLKHKVEHHLENEEHTIFQLTEKVLSKDDKNILVKASKEYMADRRSR